MFPFFFNVMKLHLAIRLVTKLRFIHRPLINPAPLHFLKMECFFQILGKPCPIPETAIFFFNYKRDKKTLRRALLLVVK